jgi:hypothetical protein
MLIRCTNEVLIVNGLSNVTFEILLKFIYGPTYQYSGVVNKVEI